jgi:sialidase-1
MRALPSTCETVAYKDGGLFPVLSLTPDGGVMAVLRGGAGHLGLDGRIEVIRSRDMGHTWSPPQVVADTERDDRNPALGLSRQGTLILAYHAQGTYDDNGIWQPIPHSPADNVPTDILVTRSHDGGLTWETPYPLGCHDLHSGSPFGKIVTLNNGTLIMGIYGGPHPGLLGERMAEMGDSPYCSYLVRSYDDGLTWGEPSVIAPQMNETGLIALADGDLLAVTRGDKPVEPMHVTRSSDGGRTWSSPVQLTGTRQHPADLVQLSDGSLLLTYGNRTTPYRIEGRVSRDGGRS